MIGKLESAGVLTSRPEIDSKNLPFSGQSFVLTGTLETFSRLEATQRIEERWKSLFRVSKRLLWSWPDPVRVPSLQSSISWRKGVDGRRVREPFGPILRRYKPPDE